MDNKYTTGWAILILLCFTHIQRTQAQTSAYGNFPYYQGFRSTFQPSEIEKVSAPSGSSGNAVTFTANGMQLTPAEKEKFGGVFVKDRQFRANQGIRIEFDYVIYGGTGADGMSVFLFDAGEPNPAIGAPGAGIGYAYNRANNDHISLRAPGLSGAYLGIALDSYGNFNQRRWQGDARVNGIPDLTTSSASSITLRGAQGGSAQLSQFSTIGGMGNRYTGYPVLISQPTQGNSQGSKLNEANGQYNTIGTYRGNFNLRGGQSSYRKAIIELFPSPDGNGLLVTVKIEHDQTTTTVIDNYHYKTSLVYMENAHTSSGDYNTLSTSPPISVSSTLNASVPSFFRIGFAASTGGLTDIHLLRELKITLPSSAEAKDDYGSTSMATSVSIDVLNNDKGYSGSITKDQTGSKDLLDPYTFRFCDQAGNFLGTIGSSETSYSTTEGVWRFNFTTKKLTFTPDSRFVGQATIKYSIKAGLNNEIPYSDEAYRSLPASVTVDVIPPKAVISNRMVTPMITR